MSDQIPNECNCCGSEDVDLTDYPDGWEVKWLCTLCAGTLAGYYYSTKNKDVSNYSILQAICFVGNEILKEIRKK